ncbi:hypothetical protein A9Q81_08225 [Gammaproteobacteria bacterium 42_54_T18]|nr:hypothetical protein A9Q81_08225 [Gammaproteobacteria bacterium 42_54_T18]
MPNVKNAFVASPGIMQIIESIELKRGTGHRRCPGHLTVVGESGSGKTTLLEHLQNLYPKTTTDNNDKDIIPLVQLSFPAGLNTFDMIKQLLEALGDPDYEERTQKTAEKRLWKYLKECQVDFICFDEFHDIRDGNAFRVDKYARRFIKKLSNKSKVIVIAFGIEEVKDLIKQEKELNTRFQEVFYMPVYSIYDGQRKVFEKYLLNLSEYIDIDNPEHLYSGDFPERLFIATRALPRMMALLIDRALDLAGRDGRKRVTKGDYYKAALAFQSTERQAKVFTLKKEKLEELVSAGVYKNPNDSRSLEVLEEYFGKKDALPALLSE